MPSIRLRGRASAPPPVVGAAPVCTGAPVISGTARVGQTLSSTTGTWTGNPTFTRKWFRDGIEVMGATAATYPLYEVDFGKTVALAVIGTNASGAVSVFPSGVSIAAAPGNVVNVANDTQLNAALASPSGGDIITLAPGTYSRISLIDYVGPGTGIVIKSADPANKALVQGIECQGMSWVSFRQLEITENLRFAGAPCVYLTTSNSLTPCSHVTVAQCKIHNTTMTPYSDPNVTANTGGGVRIDLGSYNAVIDNEITHVSNGVSPTGQSHFTLTGNNIHYLNGDGTTVTGCTFGTFGGGQTVSDLFEYHIGLPDSGHSDALQFETTSGQPSTDIMIDGFTYTRGAGDPVQGIFLGNELNIEYPRVTIRNVTMAGTSFTAVALGVGRDSLIELCHLQAYNDAGAANIAVDSGTNVVVRHTASSGIELLTSLHANVNVDTSLDNTTLAAIPPP